MATTYTTNKRFSKQGSGDNPGAWGTGAPDGLNLALDAIDSAVGGVSSISVTGGGAGITLSQAQYTTPIIVFTGTLSAALAVNFPVGKGGIFTIVNTPAGAASYTTTLQVTGAPGRTVVAPAFQTVQVYSDGTNVGFCTVTSLPIGGSMQWWSDTLPSGFAVTWAWMNGQSLAVATYPALAAVYPGLISAGNIILPDMRENVPLGKSTMGGAANPGRIPQYNTTALLTQAGEGKHTLLLAELATHNHNGATGNQSADHTHTFSDYYYTTTGNAPTTVQSGVGAAPLFSVTDAQGFLANTTNVNGTNHTHTIPNAGTATPFNVVQPSLVCNWVMRVA